MRPRSSPSTRSERNSHVTDTAEATLTDEAILQRFLRTKNQPTGSQTLGFRLVSVSQERPPVSHPA